MSIRYDDIANRLKAFRLGSSMSVEEIAAKASISRAAIYRLEKGELVKIETVVKLAELMDISVTTLLGVGIEYVSSAVAYFERLRQIEEKSDHITVLAGPISYLLTSEGFINTIESALKESIPTDLYDRGQGLADVARIINILQERREAYRKRKPSIVNLISGLEIQRFVRDGPVGTYSLSPEVRKNRVASACAEIRHLATLAESEPIGVQIGIVPEALPHTGFQLFRQSDREVLTISPFRLGEHPNISVGVAMITSAPEALSLHHKTVNEMWKRAKKGPAAGAYFRQLLKTVDSGPVELKTVKRASQGEGRSAKKARR